MLAQIPVVAKARNGSNDDKMATAIAKSWTPICDLDDIVPNTGVCALVDGEQVAMFRVGTGGGSLRDRQLRSQLGGVACSRAAWSGSLGERTVVASPIYKHHFDLHTGECLEAPEHSVRTYARARRGRGKCSRSRAPAEEVLRRPIIAKAARRRRRPIAARGNQPAHDARASWWSATAWPACARSRNCSSSRPDLYDITVFGAEPHGNYNRILLSPVLAGEKTVDDIMLNPREWYAEHGIALHAGDPVVEIDRPRRTVRSPPGVEAHYDRAAAGHGLQALHHARCRATICTA